MFSYIRRRLSVTLSLWVVLFVVAIFVVVLLLFYSFSRAAVIDEAMEKAEKTLDITLLRVEKVLHEVVTAEENMSWLVLSHLQTPDSMFTYSKEILVNNPNAVGCSIAFEPYYFSKSERWFSAYSYNEGDTILTEQEGTERYDYYSLEWYTKPKAMGKSYWIDPFHEVNTGGIEVPDIITSYCSPLYDKEKNFIGVFSIDISLEWLSDYITQMKPYPNSYSMMLDRNGRFIVHPDTSQVFYETIFSDEEIEPEVRQKLGRAMTAGDSGSLSYKKGMDTYYTFYKPLGDTGWSVAIVCPESDVLSGYYRLLIRVISVTVVGLILLLFFCWFTISRKLFPLKRLADTANQMAHGNFMGNMPASMRQDEIGQLQNIFGNMQMSIVEYIENLRVKNEELLQANERAMVAESMKTAFLQNMTHQIRTPLNHVTGFAQVIQSGYKNIPEDEMKLMIDGMIQGTQTITVILNQLIDISELDSNLKIEKSDEVNPTDLCLEAIQLIKPKHPETVKLDVESDIPDDFRMHTNRMWMLKVFHALLDNSNKFTKEGSIIISCHKKNDKYIEFAVTDTGCGIPKEQRENIFTKFVKLDEFADGIGIGLSLCRNITQLLGGDIVLDMDFKNGSRFVVTLPVD